MASVGFSNGVLVIASLMVVATLMLLTVFARLYRKAGPHEALVVYVFRGTRIVKGRGTVIFPMIENSHELSLELMSFDVAPQQDLYTRQGVAVTVEAVAQIKVKSDPESILTAAEQFLTKSDEEREGLIRLVMEGHLRGIIGQLTVEEIVKQPEMVGDRMRATCADDMNKMGLEVISFTIKEVRDKNEYITNMGRPDIARIKRDADVAAAEAERHADATRTQGQAEAEIIFKKGEAEAKAMNVKAEAYQEWNQAAVVDRLIGGLPDVVRALAAPLANVDRITIVSTGDGEAAGMNKITGDLTKMAAQIPALFETLSGMQMSELFAKIRTIGEKNAPPATPSPAAPQS